MNAGQHSQFNGGRVFFLNYYYWFSFLFFFFFFKFHDVCCLSCDKPFSWLCSSWQLVVPQVSSPRIPNRARVINSFGVSKLWFLRRICSVWCNALIIYVVSASWILTASLLRVSISQVGCLVAGTMFVLYELTVDPAAHKSCWKRRARVE